MKGLRKILIALALSTTVCALVYFNLSLGTEEAGAVVAPSSLSTAYPEARIHPWSIFSCVVTFVPPGKESTVGKLALEAISSFMNTRLPGAPLTVVDDASSGPFLEALKAVRLKNLFQLYQRKENGGASMAKNSCLRLFSESNAMYLFIFEQDVKFRKKLWQVDYIRLGNDLNAHHMSWIGEEWLRKEYGQTNIVSERYKSDSGIPYLISVTYTGQLSYLTRVAVARMGGFIVLPKPWGYAHVAYTQRAKRMGLTKEFYDLQNGDSILTVASEHTSVYSKQDKDEAKRVNAEYMQMHGVDSYIGFRPFIEYKEDVHLQPELQRNPEGRKKFRSNDELARSSSQM